MSFDNHPGKGFDSVKGYHDPAGSQAQAEAQRQADERARQQAEHDRHQQEAFARAEQERQRDAQTLQREREQQQKRNQQRRHEIAPPAPSTRTRGSSSGASITTGSAWQPTDKGKLFGLIAFLGGGAYGATLVEGEYWWIASLAVGVPAAYVAARFYQQIAMIGLLLGGFWLWNTFDPPASDTSYSDELASGSATDTAWSDWQTPTTSEGGVVAPENLAASEAMAEFPEAIQVPAATSTPSSSTTAANDAWAWVNSPPSDAAESTPPGTPVAETPRWAPDETSTQAWDNAAAAAAAAAAAIPETTAWQSADATAQPSSTPPYVPDLIGNTPAADQSALLSSSSNSLVPAGELVHSEEELIYFADGPPIRELRLSHINDVNYASISYFAFDPRTNTLLVYGSDYSVRDFSDNITFALGDRSIERRIRLLGPNDSTSPPYQLVYLD